MAGLVLEGGSLRGIFSAGIMDALLDNGIHFDYVIGVSAGITNGVSYISGQPKRNLNIIKKYRNDNRYLSKRNLLRCGSIFGLNFIFDEIPNKLELFDWDAYSNFNGRVRVGVTDAMSGEAVYMDGKQMDKKCTMLRATCAIPLCFPPIVVGGRKYFDGGLSDSIPIRQSIADGNKQNLVILTQPKGYIKTQGKSAKLIRFLYKRKFPGMVRVVQERSEMYNNTIAYIEELQEKTPNDVLVLQPDYSLSSFESDVTVLEKTYHHGYEIAIKNLDKIRALVK